MTRDAFSKTGHDIRLSKKKIIKNEEKLTGFLCNVCLPIAAKVGQFCQ